MDFKLQQKKKKIICSIFVQLAPRLLWSNMLDTVLLYNTTNVCHKELIFQYINKRKIYWIQEIDGELQTSSKINITYIKQKFLNMFSFKNNYLNFKIKFQISCCKYNNVTTEYLKIIQMLLFISRRAKLLAF